MKEKEYLLDNKQRVNRESLTSIDFGNRHKRFVLEQARIYRQDWLSDCLDES